VHRFSDYLCDDRQSRRPETRVPRFEDYAVQEKWDGTAAPVKFETWSDREFRTQFTNASKEPPNFAGHYRVATWAAAQIALRAG
jgi:hypothetical protein